MFVLPTSTASERRRPRHHSATSPAESTASPDAVFSRRNPEGSRPRYSPVDLLAVAPDRHAVARPVQRGLLPRGDLALPVGRDELPIDPVEQRLEDARRARRRGRPPPRGSSRPAPERLAAARDVQADADGEVGRLPLRARLGQDPGELAPADVEVVGPLQIGLDAARSRAPPRASSAPRRSERRRAGSPGLATMNVK